ncbi:MAG: hypothetical protein QXP77_02985 [Candidatus Aenigmatarchaeota archaeon]
MLEKENVEKIINNVLSQWKYMLEYVEWAYDEYERKGKEVKSSELFIALNCVEEIISNTSSGSIYHSLMEIYGLNSKYDGDFTKLWGSAKDLRFKILDELEYILKGRKREK